MLRLPHSAWLCLWLGSAVGHAQQADPPQKNPLRPAGETRTFSHGVRINWQQLSVELDAIVVLREGPLELLACTPRTREHESILTVAARPLDVFHALGLIGAEPGSPVDYDEAANRLLPPIGQPLELTIRYDHNGRPRTVHAFEWLSTPTGLPLTKPVDWVFAGSRMTNAKRFAADTDGTVICVVDFDTAVVAVGKLHSADNAELWVTANTQAIPPIGTRCTINLSLGKKAPNMVIAELLATGELRQSGLPTPAPKLAKILSTGHAKTLLLRPKPGVRKARIERTIHDLIEAGIRRQAIRIRSWTDSTPRLKDNR